MHRLTSDEHPVDRKLFGPLGEAARKLATDLPRGAAGYQYTFMDNCVFGAITDGRRMTQIYLAGTVPTCALGSHAQPATTRTMASRIRHSL